MHKTSTNYVLECSTKSSKVLHQSVNMKEYPASPCSTDIDAYSLAGNKTAGNYKEFEGAVNLQECVIQCCAQKENCNVAFVFNQTCYHVKCISDEQCLPLERPNVRKQLKMVLVNPATEGLLLSMPVVPFNAV